MDAKAGFLGRCKSTKRTTETRPASASKAAPSVRGPKFLKMPIVWIDRLNTAKLAVTFKVANHLLRKEYETHQPTIRLANIALVSIGITPHTKWRALAELERLGLVHIERHTRKSPVVTLLHLRETTEP
jgi:hypothetical protein